MTRFVLFTLVSLFVTGVGSAQDRTKTSPTLRRDGTLPKAAATPAPQREAVPERTSVSLSQTPEMWFYEQERSRWEDPQSAVRRNAEARASQRANRIASMRWYGMSNSRPSANATPLYGTYSPTWVANSFDPNRWRTGYDTPSTVLLVR